MRPIRKQDTADRSAVSRAVLARRLYKRLKPIRDSRSRPAPTK